MFMSVLARTFWWGGVLVISNLLSIMIVSLFHTQSGEPISKNEDNLDHSFGGGGGGGGGGGVRCIILEH